MLDPPKKMFSNESYSDSASTASIYGKSGINDGNCYNTFQTDKYCYKGLAPTGTRELCVILLPILVQFMGISADTLLGGRSYIPTNIIHWSNKTGCGFRPGEGDCEHKLNFIMLGDAKRFSKQLEHIIAASKSHHNPTSTGM